MKIHTYTIVAAFGAETLTAKKTTKSEALKLIEAVWDFGGHVIEIIEEE